MKRNKPIPKHSVAKKALYLANSEGWQALSLQKLSKHTKIPLSHLEAQFTNKYGILPLFVGLSDQDLQQKFKKSKFDGSLQDRLFEVLITRFEFLEKNRRAINGILLDLQVKPHHIKPLIRPLYHSMNIALNIAQKSSIHVDNKPFKNSGLLLVYGLSMQAWIREKDSNLNKTMATLNRILPVVTKCFN